MTSPLAKGLFRRVIAQSGAVLGLGKPDTLSQAEKRGMAFARSLKVAEPGSSRELRAISVSEILKAAEALDSYPQRAISASLSTVTSFQKLPRKYSQKARSIGLVAIAGSNARERIPRTDPPEHLSQAIESAYQTLASRALILYQQPKADPLYGTPGEQWSTDNDFRCPAIAQLAWHAAAGIRLTIMNLAALRRAEKRLGRRTLAR